MPIKLIIRLFALTTLISLCCTQSTNSAYSTEPKATVAGIELDALRNAGYRIDWINQSNANNLHMPTIIHESIYTIDGEDYLTRYDLQSGKWLWSTPVGNQRFEIRSITEFPEDGRVYVISDGALYILEKTTGNFPTVQSKNGSSYTGQKKVLPLKWVANTPAITTDQRTIIYGSSNGDAIWFNPAIGYDTARYHIGPTVRVQPSYATGVRNKDGLKREVVLASSSDGTVIALDLSQISKLWSIKLTSPVETKIEYGTNSQTFDDEDFSRTSVFIAGTDHYLRAADLHTGKQRWNILTAATLTDAPVFIQDRVYQRIPSLGLACYNAFPRQLSGERIWLAEDVHGNVITTTKSGQLVCWDSVNSLLQIVDPRKGGVMATLSIPNAKDVLANDISNGDLYVLTNDNVLLRLVPRH